MNKRDGDPASGREELLSESSEGRRADVAILIEQLLNLLIPISRCRKQRCVNMKKHFMNGNGGENVKEKEKKERSFKEEGTLPRLRGREGVGWFRFGSHIEVSPIGIRAQLIYYISK